MWRLLAILILYIFGSVTNADAVTVSVSPSTVAPGATVTVTVLNGPGNQWDCVSLATGPTPASSWISYTFLAPFSTTGTLTFVMPSLAGTYGLSFWQNCNTWLAAATATVQGTAPPPTLTITPSTAAPGATVTVTVQNGPGNQWDCVSLATGPTPASSWISHTFLPAFSKTATLTFTMPSTAGTYGVGLWSQCNTWLTAKAVTVATPQWTLFTQTTAVGGGVPSPHGLSYVNNGASVVLNAIPNGGWMFVRWDGIGCTSTTSPVTVVVTANTVCTVTFAPTTFPLTLTTTGGPGTVSPANGNYPPGTSLTIVATGSGFQSWTCNGVLYATTPSAAVTMNGPVSCTATFVPTWNLAVNGDPGSTGTGQTQFTPNGIVTPNYRTYNDGTTVIINATPDLGFLVSGITCDGGPYQPNPVTLIMTAHHTCYVKFDVNPATFRRTYVPSTETAGFVSPFKPWCGVAAAIYTPAQQPVLASTQDFIRAYVGVTSLNDVYRIRVGWESRGGSLAPRLWLNDPWYGGFPNNIPINQGWRIQTMIACCVDVNGKFNSFGPGNDYFGEWYIDPNSSSSNWIWIGGVKWSLMGGSFAKKLVQEVEIASAGPAPDISNGITFYNTQVKLYNGAAPGGTGQPCTDFSFSWGFWGYNPTNVINAAPYYQWSWIAPYNLGYVYKP